MTPPELGHRSIDERPVAAGGGGSRVRPMLAADRGGFLARHELWDDAAHAAAAELRRVVDELGLDRVRFSFADQHGLLRGKTVTRDALAAALRDGVSAPSSLLVKDTSGRSVQPVFGATGRGAGAGDVVLVPDPTTFRVLPWAHRTGWVLCDLRWPDGAVVRECTRSLLRGTLTDLALRGMSLTVGVELEFHLFRPTGSAGLAPDQVAGPGAPGRARDVEPVTPGAQLLLEEGLDAVEDVVDLLQRGLADLDLPLRTLELEFGPGQLELTLQAADAATAADAVVLTRAAVRQLCRRAGLQATFMSRPAGSTSASTGWHLHQSLRDAAGDPVLDPGPDDDGPLSPTGSAWLAGLLEHARAGAVFSTPTVNGYKRYLPMSLAPDRVAWGVDDKGAMLRVVPVREGAGARLENRAGEPAANPFLYVAAQVVAGLDGVDRGLVPPPPAGNPYAVDAPPLPRSLGEALDALAADPVYAAAWGTDVVAWYAAIKRAEFDRYLAHVSDWEQREYLSLL